MSSNEAGISADSGYDVLAGTIIAAHGVQGAVKLRLATKTALQLISTGSSVSRRPMDVWLKPGSRPGKETASVEQGQPATITQVKEMQPGGNVYLAKLQNVRDRNQAEALIGMSVYAPEARRAPLQEDEYFTNDLIGLQVVGDTGQEYGKIVAVLPQPANDVYETDQGALIPAVKAFVQKIDVAGGRVLVYDVPGLRPEEAEELTPEANVRGEDSEDEQELSPGPEVE